jgi:hypothetical protein
VKKDSRRTGHRRRRSATAIRTLKWLGGLAIVGSIVFAVSRSSGIAYTERDIGVVNFSALTPDEKREALTAANSARCTCGCGMTLARCVATDTSCPLRDDNIRTIRRMVDDARN